MQPFLLVLVVACSLQAALGFSLHDVLAAGDVTAAKLEAALAAGADIDEKGPGGQTPLMRSVLSGQAPLQEGRMPATMQLTNMPHAWPLTAGEVAAVVYLLEKGADTSIGEKDGCVRLGSAPRLGELDGVLIIPGAACRYTPVHGAAFQGRSEIMQILIDHGLDPNDMSKRDG